MGTYINMNIQSFQKNVYQVAVDHGFWEQDQIPLATKKAEKIALMHSELSEALEAVRKPGKQDKYCPEFFNEAVEFADLFIRLLDYCEHYGIPLEDAAKAKNEFNKNRPYKHGKTI